MKWIRKPCPMCSSRTGFAIDSESGGYICHSCKVQGHISKLQIDFDHNLDVIRSRFDSRFDEGKPKPQAIDPVKIWESLRPAVPRGPTDQYLTTRGIRYETWADLGLREGRFFEHQIKAVYPFRDFHGVIRALHTTRHSSGLKEKRYIGPKSKGVAMLSTQNPVIIAEGLENALAYRQTLKRPSGLCVGGDSGNIIKYVVDHKIILSKHKYIFVEDEDPEGIKASVRFRNHFDVIKTIYTESCRDAVDMYSEKD